MSPARVRVAGHFGEFLQGRLGPDGPVALITLPCAALAVDGWHHGGAGLSIHGTGQTLISPRRARSFLAGLGLRLSGRVRLRAAMPAGGGAGASTASLVALARLAGAAARPEVIARACLATEGACDPIMFPSPERILWASRAARALRPMPPVPSLEIVGGFFGRPVRTDARDSRFPDISDLVEAWRAAALAGRAAPLAEIARESARRTLALRGPADDPTEVVAHDLGAAGYVIGHTGSARGLLFVPGRIPDNAVGALREAGLRGIVRFRVGVKV